MTDQAAWYYIRNGGSAGPEALKRLLELLDEGAITRQTLVWQQGAAEWQPLESALGLSTEGPPPLPGKPPGMPPLPAAVDAPMVAPLLSHNYPDFSPHPWRRYFARMLDTTVGASLTMFLLGAVLFVIDEPTFKGFIEFLNKPESRLVETLIYVVAAMPANAILIGFTGSSLGKWIFGITVSHLDSQPIGFRLALQREALVWWRGMGLGLPLISLFTLVNSFGTLRDEQKTSWDRELLLKVVHRPDSTRQTVLNFFGILLFLVVIGFLASLK